MLATGDLKGADQFTRDALIKAAGAGSQKRDFVYWTEVKKIPRYVCASGRKCGNIRTLPPGASEFDLGRIPPWGTSLVGGWPTA